MMVRERVIQRKEIIPLLLLACPGFRKSWDKHLKDWKGEVAGDYNDAAAFAHYIVDCYGRGDTKEFKAAFSAIEQIIKDGEEDAKGVAIVGILEDIQTISTHRPFGKSAFLQFLRPLSRKAWREIEELWAGKSSLAEVVRAEAEAEAKRVSEIAQHEVKSRETET